jgi:translation initiation factor 2B subunit (eIF-2B alpha/beta/delta family)
LSLLLLQDCFVRCAGQGGGLHDTLQASLWSHAHAAHTTLSIEVFPPDAACMCCFYCSCRLALSDALDKVEASMQRQRVATINNTAAVLQSGMRVLTTSLSSTVAKALIKAHQQALTAAPAAGAKATTPAQRQAVTTGPAGHAGSADISTSIAETSAQQQDAAGILQDVLQSQEQQQEEADVDDPDFWPSSSGIGREAPDSSSTLPLFLAGNSGSFKGSSHGPGLSVIVCESRPLCEGVAMAQRLAAAGLHVTVITDAQAGVFVEEADLVLLGADAVTPAGVVNKVGSRLLALAAKAAGVPVVAVTDSLKVSPGPVTKFALPNTTLQVRGGSCMCMCMAAAATERADAGRGVVLYAEL